MRHVDTDLVGPACLQQDLQRGMAANCSSTLKCVTEGLPTGLTAIRVRCVGWRPIGMSMVPLAGYAANHQRGTRA